MTTLDARPLDPVVIVEVRDGRGNLVTSSTSVTLTLRTPNGATATLGGTVVRAAAGGRASFDGLAVAGPGIGFTLQASATGAPTVVSSTFDVAPRAVAIDSTNMHLTSDSATRAAGVYSFQLMQPGASIPDSGRIIVGAEQGGFLRRIIHSTRSGSTVQYTTIPASLSEIIQDDSIVIGPPASGGLLGGRSAQGIPRRPYFVPASSRISGADCSSGSCDITELVLAGIASNGVVLEKGHFGISLNPSLKAVFGGRGRPISAVVKISGVANFNSTIRIGISRAIVASGSYIVGTIVYPFAVDVVGIPVVGEFRAPLSVEWSADIAGQADVRLDWTSIATATAGAEWQAGVGWTTFTSGGFQATPTIVTPSVNASASAQVGLKFDLGVILYDALSGDVSAQPFIGSRLDVDLLANQYRTSCHSALLLGFGLKLDIIGNTILSYSPLDLTLFDSPIPACSFAGPVFNPSVHVSTATAPFATSQGAADPTPAVINVTNGSGQGTLSGLSFAIAYDGGSQTGWLYAGLGNTTAPTTLTLSPTTGSLPVGSYHATVNVMSNGPGVTGSPQPISVPLTISTALPTPDFSVSVAPGSQTVAQGGTATYLVTLTSLNGFAGQVTLTALNLPTGYVAVGTGFTPTTATVPVGGTATSTLRIVTGSGTAIEARTTTIQGTSGGTSHTTPITTTVTAVTPAADFSLQVLPISQTVTQGATVAYGVTLQSLNGFAGLVSLTALNLPPGYVVAGTGFSPQTVSLSANGSAGSSLAIVTGAGTAIGSPITTIQAIGGSVTHAMPITTTITTQPTAPTIALSATTASFAATAGGSSPATQSGIQVTNGGTGTLSGLSVGTITYQSAQPTGWLSASLGASTAPANLTLSATTGSLAAGTYTAFVPIQSSVSGVTSRTVTVTFVVASGVTTGGLALAVTGLPDGMYSRADITGPGGVLGGPFYAYANQSPTIISSLTPGAYTLSWNSASCAFQSGCAQVSYGPASTPQQITVVASQTPTNATMNFVPTTGVLQLAVSGLPNTGDYGQCTVSGPSGLLGGGQLFTARIGDPPFALTNLTPGQYVVTWQDRTIGGTAYRAAQVQVQVTASASPTTATGSYR